jgi:hypothetical protein
MTFLYEEIDRIGLMSRFIFSKESIDRGNFKRYYNTYFVHVGVIMEYLLSLNSINVFCYNHNSFVMSSTPLKMKTAWLLTAAQEVIEGSFWLFMSVPNLNNSDRLLLMQKFASFMQLDYFLLARRHRSISPHDWKRVSGMIMMMCREKYYLFKFCYMITPLTARIIWHIRQRLFKRI